MSVCINNRTGLFKQLINRIEMTPKICNGDMDKIFGKNCGDLKQSERWWQQHDLYISLIYQFFVNNWLDLSEQLTIKIEII